MTSSPTTTAINADSMESTRHIRTRTASESVTCLVAMISHFRSARPWDFRSLDQALVAPVTNVTQIITRIPLWSTVSQIARIVIETIDGPPSVLRVV